MQVTYATSVVLVFVALWSCALTRPAEFRRHHRRHFRHAHRNHQFGSKAKVDRPFQDWSSDMRKGVVSPAGLLKIKTRHAETSRHLTTEPTASSMTNSGFLSHADDAKRINLTREIVINSMKKYVEVLLFKYEFVG